MWEWYCTPEGKKWYCVRPKLLTRSEWRNRGCGERPHGGTVPNRNPGDRYSGQRDRDQRSRNLMRQFERRVEAEEAEYNRSLLEGKPKKKASYSKEGFATFQDYEAWNK